MKERPILFSGAMVRALLAGTKTQARRIMKPQPPEDCGALQVEPIWPTVVDRHGDEQPGDETFGVTTSDGEWCLPCRYGQPGDLLWVRETFMHEPASYEWSASVSIPAVPAFTAYKADFPDAAHQEGSPPWKPSIHMPRNLSRLTLEITDVRVERLQDISEADALAEGVKAGDAAVVFRDGKMIRELCNTARGAYCCLWESINGPGSWDANPLVWALTFKRMTTPNEAAAKEREAHAGQPDTHCGLPDAARRLP